MSLIKNENIEPFIKILLEKDIINRNEYKMARNISDTLNVKIETVLLEKGFITEDLLFKILAKSQSKRFSGILPLFFEKYTKKVESSFEEINIESSDFSGILGYIPDNIFNNMMNSPKMNKTLKEYNITKNDQYFILTNTPYKLFDNSLYKKLISKNPLGVTPKIYFLESKKYKNFLLNISERWKNVSNLIEKLNFSNIEKNITDGILKNFIFENLFQYAIEVGASDIHIEPDIFSLNFRMRKDGVLNFLCSLKKEYIEPVFSIINEKTKQNEVQGHKPVDGQFTLKHKVFGDIAFRWGENRTIYGHHIVLRILNNDVQGLTLDKINYTSKNLRIIKKMIQEPNGIILITGPTGSGKTNTLAAVLKKLSKPEIKVLSLEDPVEIKLPIIQQVQVNPKNHLTVHAGLKSFLRQDPDVMFIGEIRDKEMGEHAIIGAMTGHLMLATLHTNDAVSSIIRLEDMGIEKSHIANTLKMVIAQRLLRVLCTCKIKVKQETIMTDENYTDFSIDPNSKIYKHNPEGCEKCSFTGYNGRVPIAEIFVIDKQAQNLILKGEEINKILEQIRTNGFSDLKSEAIDLVNSGKTDITELIRVLGSSNQDSAFQYFNMEDENNLEEF